MVLGVMLCMLILKWICVYHLVLKVHVQLLDIIGYVWFSPKAKEVVFSSLLGKKR